MVGLNDRVFAKRLRELTRGDDGDFRKLLSARANGSEAVDAREALAKAIQRYQRLYKPDIDRIARSFHGRDAIVDGDLGPATIAHLGQRRCDTPDFASDGTLIEEANWPPSCRHEVTIFIDWSTWGDWSMGMSAAAAKEQFEKALRDWNLTIDATLVLVASSSEARVTVDFQSLGGSTLAWSHLANNDCGRKQQRYDVRKWYAHLLFLTILHEVGHLIGLPHSPGNYVMNPSIIIELPGLTDADKSRAIALGYGPSKLDPDQPDEPNPDDPNEPERGVVKISGVLKNGTSFVSADVKAIEWRTRLGKFVSVQRFEN